MRVHSGGRTRATENLEHQVKQAAAQGSEARVKR